MSVALASIERAALVTEEAVSQLDVLIEPHERAFVTETSRGLSFSPDTPIEVWSLLVVRLIVQAKRVEWALADAINFGERAYGDLYAHWVQETGLNKRTLQNYARVGRQIEPARRRADISFSHHAEVAALPPAEQKKLLDRAESEGMNRYQLRDAVREHRQAEETQSHLHAGVQEISRPEIWHLTKEARAALEQARIDAGDLSDAYVRGWLDSLIWSGAELAFKEGVLG